ncbi:hypothetical protein EIP86_011348 [Pleurotus ostreatoroseus]|nr:hypothetical protein EIP86_011348 [Pleurotus ostreatoroseus]
MSSATPLRDRPQAADPWQPTTPLRISKRADSPVSQQPPPAVRPPLDRRSSGSYTALKDRKVVSKSPFLVKLSSSIPVPSRPSANASPRKVSGEKRQRTQSMNNQAENEHPLGFKRRQSRGFQGLLSKEPVTKSPFRKPPPAEDIEDMSSALPTPTPTDEEDGADDENIFQPPPTKELFADANGRLSPSPHRTSSPARSSLVSRRLHGPRTPSRGSESDRDAKAERRKTVTFDETCDVMEYDVEDEDSGVLTEGAEPFSWVRDNEEEEEEDSFELRANLNAQLNRNMSSEEINMLDEHDTHPEHDDDAPTQDDSDLVHHEHHDDDEDERRDQFEELPPRGRTPTIRKKSSFDLSIEGLHINADDSITGLVNSMLEDARPHTPPATQTATAAQHTPIPLPFDAETEGGVPLGRTHHSERAREAHRVHSALFHEDDAQHARDEDEEPVLPPFIATASISTIPSTPPKRGSLDAALSPGPQVPLGRSTHSERRQARREAELEREREEDEEMNMLPPSPSPAKAKRDARERERGALDMEGVMPKFEFATISGFNSTTTGADPFFLAEPVAKPFAMHSNLSRDSLFADARSSTPVNFDGMPPPSLGVMSGSPSGSRGASPLPTTNSRGASPMPIPTRSGSPSSNPSRGGSPIPGSPGSPHSPRISREEVQRRLAKKRSGSFDSLRNSYHAEEGRDLGKEREKEEKKEREGETTPSGRRVATEGGPSRASLDGVTGTGSASGPNKIPRVPPPPLSRLNPSYDGVMSIDPAPQPSDPPRPSLPTRAASFQDATETGASSPFVDAQLIDAYDAHTATATSSTEGDAASTTIAGSDTGTPFEGTPSKNKGVQLGDMRSALDRLMADVAGEAKLDADGKGVSGLKVEAVAEGVQARRHSAPVEAHDAPEVIHVSPPVEDERMDVDEPPKLDLHVDIPPPPKDVSALLHTNFLSPTVVSPLTAPPLARTPSTRDAIRKREELIKAKKREARRREAAEAGSDSDESGDEQRATRTDQARPNRRRSKSTGDAETMAHRRTAADRRRDNVSGGTLFDLVPLDDEEDPLTDSIDRELERLRGPGKKYHVRQRSETIYASSDSRAEGSSDGDSSKAWRSVKRPSDMNEYAKQIKELQAQENSGKGYAKVFVKVLGIKNLTVPIPQQPTASTCTLNNGIHFVTTPEYRLGRESRIDQEFELIEHSKLEFTLAIKVRRDPHIVSQFKANTPPPPPPPPPIVQAPASKGGVRSFFLGSTPRRSSKASPTPPPPPPPPVHRLQENLARYLKPDGTLGRAFITFKDIAKRCDTRLFETSYPLIGQKSELNGASKTMQIGEIVLQLFRLPPLPGIPSDQLPQSLEECHRGLRHIAWHKVTYFEGTLTQNGGDCLSWRRRHLRVIGSNLVAFNDITKRAIATIDLKKAIGVEDDQEAREELMSPASAQSHSSRYFEFDGPYGVERSFRLLFPNSQEITFFADTDEEKAKWLEVLRALVGRIPPNPLWAELLWQRQQQLAKQAAAIAGPSSSSIPRPSSSPYPQNR